MKKEIEQEVKLLFEQGKTHQEIFDELKGTYNTQGKLLTSVLCKTPIPQRKEQYKWAWVLLLIFLGALTCMRLINMLAEPGLRTLHLIFAGILIYIIISVAKYEKYTFQFLGVVGLVNIFVIIRNSWYLHDDLLLEKIIIIFLVIGMCITSYILYYKLFVKHSIKKESYTDSNGHHKLQVVAKFEKR